jgi:hypothetical protein
MLQQPKPWIRYHIEIAGLIIIAILGIFFTMHGYIYDEPYYLSNVDILKEHGIGDYFLLNLKGPAGPTYSVLHYILSPLTHLNIALVRAVNIVLFILSIIVLNSCFKQLKIKGSAIAGVAIPMTAVCIGMALTEMPAIFFLCLSIYFFSKSSGNQILFKFLSGIFLSIAILGRQPLLLTIPCFIYLNGFSKKAILSTIAFLIATAALPLYCFYVWKDIIPAEGNYVEEGSLVVVHFLLALGYALICFLIISPEFIRLPFKIKPLIIVLTFIASILISYFMDLKFPVLNTLAAKVLPAAVLQYYPYLCFSFLMVAGIYLLVVFAYRGYEFRHDKIILFSLFACFVILFSTLSIKHQFSSRYVFQAFPFMLIIAERFIKFSTKTYWLRIVGVVIGIASLVTYLF